MLSVETVIVIVVCLLVLILSTMYMMGVVGPGANTTQTTTNILSECIQWQRFNYNEDAASFTKDKYPTLWQTYLSECIDKKTGMVIAECDGSSQTSKDKLAPLIQAAKSYCTHEKTDDGSAGSSTTTSSSSGPSTTPSTSGTPTQSSGTLGNGQECTSTPDGCDSSKSLSCVTDQKDKTTKHCCLSGKNYDTATNSCW